MPDNRLFVSECSRPGNDIRRVVSYGIIAAAVVAAAGVGIAVADWSMNNILLNLLLQVSKRLKNQVRTIDSKWP
ncbi:MAG TPA: hypothetical protein VF172_09435 [Nitrososphaera sp.]